MAGGGGGGKFRPGHLGCLKDAEGVSERYTKAVAKEARDGGVGVEKFGHGMVGLVNKARGGRQAWSECG